MRPASAPLPPARPHTLTVPMASAGASRALAHKRALGTIACLPPFACLPASLPSWRPGCLPGWGVTNACIPGTPHTVACRPLCDQRQHQPQGIHGAPACTACTAQPAVLPAWPHAGSALAGRAGTCAQQPAPQRRPLAAAATWPCPALPSTPIVSRHLLPARIGPAGDRRLQRQRPHRHPPASPCPHLVSWPAGQPPASAAGCARTRRPDWHTHMAGSQ